MTGVMICTIAEALVEDASTQFHGETTIAWSWFGNILNDDFGARVEEAVGVEEGVGVRLTVEVGNSSMGEQQVSDTVNNIRHIREMASAATTFCIQSTSELYCGRRLLLSPRNNLFFEKNIKRKLSE